MKEPKTPMHAQRPPGDASLFLRLTNPDFANDLRVLWAEMGCLQVRFDRLAKIAMNPDQAVYFEAARDSLAVAATLARRRDVNGGWQAVHDAKESLVWLMSGSELVLEANRILLDTPHMDPATSAVLRRLLADDATKAQRDSRAVVADALNLRNEYWQSHYENAHKLATRAAGLALTMALSIAALLAMSATGTFSLFADPAGQEAAVLAATVCMGMIGGSVSSILSSFAAKKILPEQAKEGPWHYARPLIGAASALLIVGAAMSGFLGVEVASTFAILAIAGAAGFSEILLVKTMQALDHKANREAKAASQPTEMAIPAPSMQV